ncbi:S26 family signal peptidase [Mesorhizobium sp. B4-1-3]|uniref:S26 family signal peptidase n=1 Tax=Mesorhizobium sp. B4-1-3 TaxID=2589889 RepID=UPI00112A26AD|nr:S26 family signal peptidase [Mesorhizobium sp. B4-1-3]TPI13050.1 S26 family signal peptidase [Mesorhizobium sp. B4-1-3]
MSRRPSIRLIGSKLRRIRARKAISATAIGLGLLAFTVFARPSPVLVWNASASAPIGLYRVVAGAPARGDLVLARAPDFTADLAAERGYLPRNVPLVKRIAALPREHVCAFNEAIIIGGKIVARRLATDTQVRALPWWNECRALSQDEFFLLNSEASRSFDSRYFGPVPAKHIIGRLVPLWTE